jgi:hypothetical protein
VLSLLYNVNRPANKPAAEPSKFHPFTPKPKPREVSPEEFAKMLGLGGKKKK